MKKLLAILALVLAWNCVATVYYVDNSRGDDANDGLVADKPFRTLHQAMSKLEPGDTLVMVPGQVYYESLEFQKGGTPEAPIVVEANGAVISGREIVPADKWQELGDGLWLNANKVQAGALRPRVFQAAGDMISVHFQTAPQKLQPGQAVWNGDGIYYRAEAGQRPPEMTFYGCYKSSGVVISGKSYIAVNGIVAENFANDGVNVHGSCHGLIFRNLVSRWNGDDGFSIHEDAQACVYGAHLHHNDFGIQDIGISRSFYFGVLSEDNRYIGADFYGGLRSLEDSQFRNNGLRQLQFSSNNVANMGIRNGNPLQSAHAYLKNVRVSGGRGAAVQVINQADVTAVNCQFAGTEQGVNVGEQSALHLVNCAITQVGQNLVKEGGKLTALSCTFQPATATWGDRKLEGDEFLQALEVPSN